MIHLSHPFVDHLRYNLQPDWFLISMKLQKIGLPVIFNTI